MSSLWSRLNPRKILGAVEAIPDLQRLIRENREDTKATQRNLRGITRQLEAITAQLAAQQKLLAEFPEMRSRLRQCVTMPRYDERQADRARSISLDLGNIGQEMRRAVAEAPLVTEPFHHLEVPQLIPDALYRELIASLPARLFFEHLPPNRQELRVPFDFVPAYSRKVWNECLTPLVEEHLVPALLDKFSVPLDERLKTSWPDVAPRESNPLAFKVLNSRLLLRRPGYEIKPHRDPRWAFITCLIYLPKLTDIRLYGTELYRLLQDRESPSGSPFWLDYSDCELVKSVAGTAQSALAFINWSGAHSASIPSDAHSTTERYLYQVQIGPDAASRERILTAMSADHRAAWSSKADD